MSLVPLSFLLIGLIVAGVIAAIGFASSGTKSLSLFRTRKKLEQQREEHRQEMQDLRNELLLLAHSFDEEPSHPNMEAYELELKIIKDKLLQLALPDENK